MQTIQHFVSVAQGCSRRIRLTTAIAISLLGIESGHLEAIAQTPPNFGNTGQSDIREAAASRAFPDFSETGRSQQRVGGASRSGACAPANPPLTALVPVDAGYGGRTTSATPTVWVYVPYALNSDSPVTFSLQDDQGDTLYQRTFTVTQDAGIVSVSLPASLRLESGVSYDWYFLVYCNDPRRRDVPAFTSGWIEYEPDAGISEADLASMDAIARAYAYADRLLWYDALTALGEGLRANPYSPQLRATWSDLLGLPSVQLGEFSTEAIAPCCSLTQTVSDANIDRF